MFANHVRPELSRNFPGKVFASLVQLAESVRSQVVLAVMLASLEPTTICPEWKAARCAVLEVHDGPRVEWQTSEGQRLGFRWKQRIQLIYAIVLKVGFWVKMENVMSAPREQHVRGPVKWKFFRATFLSLRIPARFTDVMAMPWDVREALVQMAERAPAWHVAHAFLACVHQKQGAFRAGVRTMDMFHLWIQFNIYIYIHLFPTCQVRVVRF